MHYLHYILPVWIDLGDTGIWLKGEGGVFICCGLLSTLGSDGYLQGLANYAFSVINLAQYKTIIAVSKTQERL